MDDNMLTKNEGLVEGKNILDLTSAETLLSLSGLSPAQQRTLTYDLATRMTTEKEKQTELSLSLQGMNMKLSTLTDTAAKATDAGIDFTVKNTQEDRSGKTEVLMGNSKCAKRGTSAPFLPLRLLLIGAGVVVFLGFMTMAFNRSERVVERESYNAVPLSYTVMR